MKGSGSKHKDKHGGADHDPDFLALQRALEDVVATDPDASQYARRSRLLYADSLNSHQQDVTSNSGPQTQPLGTDFLLPRPSTRNPT